MKLKLVSPKDTLIGHVEVPDHWGKYFDRSGAASAAILPKLRWQIDRELAAMPVAVPDIRRVTLVCAGWSQYQDAVYLVHGTVEELEALPECSFTPSMAYLRTQIDASG